MKKRLLPQILSLLLCVALGTPVLAAESTFQDVPPTHWAYESVEFVVDRGLFKGTSTTIFSPNETMTRAMLLEVLYRYAGSPAVSGTVRTETSFTDVSDQAYYANALVWAYQNALLPNWFLYDSFYRQFGSEEQHILHSFQPNQVMSRFDFAVILKKFMSNVLNKPLDWDFFDSIGFDAYNCPLIDMREPGINTALITVYPEYNRGVDDTITVYYALAWAYKFGIMNGTSATTMSPAADITRAQVAAMLMRFYENYDIGSTPEPPDERPDPDPAPDPSIPTLANGAAITEENVLALLDELKVKYPDGGRYDPYDEYFSYPFYSRATECAKLAFMLSDEIWGDLPVRTHTDITKIRPGDVVESPGSSHWSLAIARTEVSEYGGEGCYCFWSVDGGPAGVITWGDPDSGTCANMYTYDGYIVHTRYPEGM